MARQENKCSRTYTQKKRFFLTKILLVHKVIKCALNVKYLTGVHTCKMSIHLFSDIRINIQHTISIFKETLYTFTVRLLHTNFRQT